MNLGERRKKWGQTELWHLSSQIITMCDKALFSWKLLNICLLMGSSKLIPYFALLMHITLLIK